MNDAGAAVWAEGVEKRFARRPAVRGVDLAVRPGDCLAVFGPNGAGKSTLLRLLAGVLKPTAGTVRVRGVDVRGDPQARAAVGLVSHHTMLYAPLTARENVEFAAGLFGVPSPSAAAREALAAMRVADVDVPVRALSRGQQQRVSIARALVHSPAVLLLDEPYAGLDEAGAVALTSLLQSLGAGGATLILVTHNLAEGLALATQAAIMVRGRLARHEARPDAGFDVATFAAGYRALAGADHDG